MFKLKTAHSVLLTLALAIAVNLALPDTMFAGDKRGRNRGRNSEKKSEKFINGHDARDGRLDGRGPKSRGKNKQDDDDLLDDDRGSGNRRKGRSPRRRRN